MKKEVEKEYHIQLARGEAGRYVILPGDPGRVEKIASHFDRPEKIAVSREYTTYAGYLDGERVACTSTGIGCPSAAIAVEELVKVGADTFIRVGTCGSLSPELGLGDLAITTATVRDEGTTRQYVPIEYPAVADLDVTLALREAAQKLGFKYKLGIGHTKDAFYSEHKNMIPAGKMNEMRWEAWKKANVISTSMEASAIFTVASIRGVRAGEVLAVVGLTYKDAPVIKKVGVDEAIRTAVEAIRILIKKDRENKKNLRGPARR